MGNELEVETDSYPSYKDYFEEQFPSYLYMGMTYDEYWYGDCSLCKFYRKKHEIAEKKTNEHLWLQGLYFTLAIGNAFSKDCPYPSSPLPYTESEYEEHLEREKKEQVAKFQAWANEFNRQRKKGG